MIIKAIRVSPRRVGALALHLLYGDENEAVTVLRGSQADLADFARDAGDRGRPYAVRHWIVAPETATTRDQASRVIAMLALEFGFDADACLVVEHRKPRATEAAFGTHWHICAPEVDAATGRVLSSAHDRPRHEFIARLAESEFGHPFTLGAHHRAVLSRLRRDGRDAVAEALELAFPSQDDRPREAFTHDAHQAAKREGLDLPAIRQAVRAAWAASDGRTTFKAALAVAGLTLRRGDKAGEFIVESDGVFAGSARRLAGVRKAEFIRRMEAKDEQHDPNHGRDDPDGSSGDERRSGDVVGTGPDTGGGAERAGELPPIDGGHTEPLGRRAGAGAGEPSGPAQGGVRAGDRRSDPAACLRGVIADVTSLADDVREMNRKARIIAAPPIDRCERFLAREEQQARLQAQEARTRRPPSRAAIESATVEAERREATMAEIRSKRQAIWEERSRLRADADAPFWKRSLSRAEREKALAELADQSEELEAKHRLAEGFLIRAQAALERAHRTHKLEVVDAKRLAESEIAGAATRLDAVAQTRRLLVIWPAISFVGFRHCHDTGARIEKARRALRNPFARDIWGLPLAGPN